jgi:hypothetical protein
MHETAGRAAQRPAGIFLSHAHEDNPFVRRLARDLRAAGIMPRLLCKASAVIRSNEHIAQVMDGVADRRQGGDLVSAIDGDLADANSLQRNRTDVGEHPGRRWLPTASARPPAAGDRRGRPSRRCPLRRSARPSPPRPPAAGSTEASGGSRVGHGCRAPSPARSAAAATPRPIAAQPARPKPARRR